MKIKKKALAVLLSDKETTVTVHAPSMSQFTEYLESFGVISRIGQKLNETQQAANGVLSLTQVKIDKAMMDEFYPLLAALSDISIEDFKDLPIEDGMAIMLAYVQLLAPESLANPTPAEVTIPQTQPA